MTSGTYGIGGCKGGYIMTQGQLEEYITKLLPTLRRKCVYTADDDEDCQRALLDLYKKVDKLEVTDNNGFISLFMSYYNTLRFSRRCAAYKKLLTERRPETYTWEEHNTYLNCHAEHLEYKESTRKSNITNPWVGNRVEALEYIELVKDKHTRDIMFQYYILGYTLLELRAGHSISEPTIYRLLQSGIKEIKDTMKSM